MEKYWRLVFLGLLIAAAGCAVVEVRLPEELKEKKTVADPPPDYLDNKPDPGTPLNP